MDKAEIRKLIKNKKINNKNINCIDFSYIIRDHFSNKHNELIIAIYSPLKSELGLNDIKILKESKLCLPFSYKNGKMIFRSINNPIKDECNILSSDGLSIDINDIDVIIVPALAYNKKGYRLGHGNGYYDKTLHDYKGLLIGTCNDECFIDLSFEEKHDLKVSYVVTEERIYKIG